MAPLRFALLIALAASLAACGQPDNAPGPGGVTVGEAKALDQAAEMIEGQTPPPPPVAPGSPTGSP